MIRIRTGKAEVLSEHHPGCDIWIADINGEKVQAVVYPSLIGNVNPGDILILNTTARYLGLGTGGVDFVIGNISEPERNHSPKGHIMKLRYTPLQVKVNCCEEDPLWQGILEQADLGGMPVIIGELHSMLPLAAAAVKYFVPKVKIVYLMTDGAALPLAFSRAAARLKANGFIYKIITCGHAFGGDFEAVNIYSGLMAAKNIVGADAAIITMGPGVVGTGTRWGFSGIELGETVNRVSILNGNPIVIPRISFADSRIRHRGISHHTLTAMVKAALKPATIILPLLSAEQQKQISEQPEYAEMKKLHKIVEWTGLESPVLESLQNSGIKVTTMGRGYKDDPVFFRAALAAGAYTAQILGGP